jgi:hypothetical protein
MLGHVHYTAAAAADDAAESTAGSEGPVPMRVVNSSWVIASSDSTPAGLLSEAMGFNRSEAQVPTGNEWGMIYPGGHNMQFVFCCCYFFVKHLVKHRAVLLVCNSIMYPGGDSEHATCLQRVTADNAVSQ